MSKKQYLPSRPAKEAGGKKEAYWLVAFITQNVRTTSTHPIAEVLRHIAGLGQPNNHTMLHSIQKN